MEVPASIAAARERLKERLGSGIQQIGGKGTARRKTKRIQKSVVNDDRKLQQALKRVGTSMLSEIEEVKMYRDDGRAMVFEKPKVQAAPGAHTYVVSGAFEERDAISPNMIQELAAQKIQLHGGVQTDVTTITDGEGKAQSDLVNFDADASNTTAAAVHEVADFEEVSKEE